DVFKSSDIIIPGATSCHTLVMSRFYVKVTVKDEVSKAPIKEATVQAEGSAKNFVTDASGVTVVEEVSTGSPDIIVKGPATALYTTIKTPVTIDNTKDTVAVEVLLKAGNKVS